MSSDPYSPRVRELFAEPRHAGELPDSTVVRVDDQGMRVELSARRDGDRLSELRFRAWGCPHFIAAAEAFCADYEGRPVSELGDFGAVSFLEALAVPIEKTGRILVLEDAVKALGQTLAGS